MITTFNDRLDYNWLDSLDTNYVHNCLRILERSHYEFCMTGSRAGLASVHSKSDWNLFTVESAIPFLKEFGFILHYCNTKYNIEDTDPLLIETYKKKCIDGNITVQIVIDMELRKQQCFIVQRKYKKLMGVVAKTHRGIIWNLAFQDMKDYRSKNNV